MSGFIDAHVHVYDADSGTKMPLRFTPADLFAHCKPSGIDRIVLIQISSYRYDNSYMLRAVKQHSGVFSAVAVVDHERSDLEPVMRDFARQGVRGWRISPRGGNPEHWLDSPGMERMWTIAPELRQAVCPLINPEALAAVDRMCWKHPETTVVIDHMARIGASGAIKDGDIRLLTGLARHRNTFVKVSAFYALGKKMPPYTDLVPLIRRLYDAYGPQRLMWASDSPFQVINGHSYAASVELVRDRLPFLKPEDKEWLLRKTAESVFF
jgi:predicted TIM-barrel fold metal-dependent hydrolase